MKPIDKNNASILLRLPEDLKAALQRQAYANGRRITSEINTRLRDSLKPATAPGIAPAPTDGKVLPPTYLEAHHVTVAKTGTPGAQENGLTLSATDHAMLQVFHSLPVEKQLALLSLFK